MKNKIRKMLELAERRMRVVGGRGGKHNPMRWRERIMARF
jgi:hypothetical protein